MTLGGAARSDADCCVGVCVSLFGGQLAKLLLLVFVVYTYYLARFISDDNHVRLVLSTGFFAAIALSMLPLVRACVRACVRVECRD